MTSHNTKIRTLIIDGQNNHEWQMVTPVLKEILHARRPLCLGCGNHAATGLATCGMGGVSTGVRRL